MKINVLLIVSAHLKTLCKDGANVSFEDLAIFFGAPTVAGLIAYWLCLAVRVDVHSVSITFFGIFIALLLNIQVALFSIFQRKWQPPTDEKLRRIQEEHLRLRNQLLRELNTNVSYMILFCTAALLIFLIFFVFRWERGVSSAVVVWIYSHFVLTLLMVTKRAHALFLREYEEA